MRHRHWLSTVCAVLLGFSSVAGATGAKPRPAEVVVLATLHQMHAQVPGYSFDRLRQVIEQLHPDVLCLEVRADKLAARAPEQTKQEYPKVIYPLLARGHYTVVAMEPSEPEYGAILRPYAQANAAFQASGGAAVAALAAYSDATYAALKTHWRDAAAVNDATTDDMLRAKHAFQQAAIGLRIGLDDLASVGDPTVTLNHLPFGSGGPLAFAVNAEPVLLHEFHVVGQRRPELFGRGADIGHVDKGRSSHGVSPVVVSGRPAP